MNVPAPVTTVHPDVIETERLLLRAPHARDREVIVDFYMSERAQYTGGNVPRYLAWKNTAAMFGHWALYGFGLWAVTVKGGDDRILGLVGPFCPDGWPEPEIGWLMFDGSEGKGFAYEAARAAITDVRARLGWSEIVHYIAPQNTRSIALAERLGATLDPDAQGPIEGRDTLVFRQPRPDGAVTKDRGAA